MRFMLITVSISDYKGMKIKIKLQAAYSSFWNMLLAVVFKLFKNVFKLYVFYLQQSFVAQYYPRQSRDDNRYEQGDDEAKAVVFHTIDEVHTEE